MEGGSSNGAAACSALPRYKNALVLPALRLRRTGSRKCSVLYAKELRAAGSEGNWATSRAGLASGCGCHEHGATAVARFAKLGVRHVCTSDGALVDASASSNRSPCPVPGAGRAVVCSPSARSCPLWLRHLLRLEEGAVWSRATGLQEWRRRGVGGGHGSLLVLGLFPLFVVVALPCLD